MIWATLTATKTRRIALVLTLVGGAGIAVVAATLGYLFWIYGRDVDALDKDAFRNYRPEQVTRILAADGTLIGELYEKRRTVVAHEVIPAHVENAFLAAEDADFYHHAGMDVPGMVRALIANLRQGKVTQGASTITQQVVKNFALSPERTIERKVQELILARRLEKLLTKREILELYLNDIYFGHGRYGVEEAAKFYFGRSVRQIDLGQAALLAALPKAPSKASPFKDPERAKARQVYVLRQMVLHGFASQAEADTAIAAPLALAEPKSRSTVQGVADEFVDIVADKLREKYGDRLPRLGATVTTTVDLDLQRKAKNAVRSGLIEVDTRRQIVRGLRPATEARQQKILAKTDVAWRSGVLHDAVVLDYGADNESIVVGVGSHRAAVRVAPGRYRDGAVSLAELFPRGAITRIEPLITEAQESVEGGLQATLEAGPQAALVLIEAESGDVVALVGGDGYERAQFNRAVQAKRQPGSSFKPFVYGAAIKSRLVTAATLIADSPEIYEKWRPTNFERDEYRGEIRVREALTHSVNTVAIKLLDRVQPKAGQEFAYAAGIESDLIGDLSLALGTSEVTPLELATAYTTLARGGSRIAPSFISEIRVPGEPVWTPERIAEQTLDPDVAFVVTSLMTSVVNEGTGQGAKALGRPVAGKTGTSADHRDAWFAGFTRDHVAVAWVGFDTPRRIGRKETGGRAALPIWLETMRAVSEGRAVREFVPPPSVEIRTIDRATGLLAPHDRPANAPENLEEYFLPGTAPTEVAAPQVAPPADLLLDLYE